MIEGNSRTQRKKSLASLIVKHLTNLGFDVELINNYTNSEGDTSQVVVKSSELGIIHLAVIAEEPTNSFQVYGKSHYPHMANKDYFAFGWNCNESYSIYFISKDHILGRSSLKLDELVEQCEKSLTYKQSIDGLNIDPMPIDQFSISLSNRKVTSVSSSYYRSPLVRQRVLHRANGKCEFCHELGFQTTSGSRYLETHHIKPLSEGGGDSVINVIALCPTDHRKAHFEKSTALTKLALINIVKNK